MAFSRISICSWHTEKEMTQALTVTKNNISFTVIGGCEILFAGNDYTVNLLDIKFMSGTLHSDQMHTMCVKYFLLSRLTS